MAKYATLRDGFPSVTYAELHKSFKTVHLQHKMLLVLNWHV